MHVVYTLSRKAVIINHTSKSQAIPIESMFSKIIEIKSIRFDREKSKIWWYIILTYIKIILNSTFIWNFYYVLEQILIYKVYKSKLSGKKMKPLLRIS